MWHCLAGIIWVKDLILSWQPLIHTLPKRGKIARFLEQPPLVTLGAFTGTLAEWAKINKPMFPSHPIGSSNENA